MGVVERNDVVDQGHEAAAHGPRCRQRRVVVGDRVGDGEQHTVQPRGDPRMQPARALAEELPRHHQRGPGAQRPLAVAESGGDPRLPQRQDVLRQPVRDCGEPPPGVAHDKGEVALRQRLAPMPRVRRLDAVDPGGGVQPRLRDRKRDVEHEVHAFCRRCWNVIGGSTP